jgi:hypothetical protein
MSNVLPGRGCALDNYPTVKRSALHCRSGQFQRPMLACSLPEHVGCIRPTNDYLRNAHSLGRYSDGEHAPFISRVS